MKTTSDSWKLDETYLKVKKEWMYLYRAVASNGKTLDFLLSPTRDSEAGKRFFVKTLAASHTTKPRVMRLTRFWGGPKRGS